MNDQLNKADGGKIRPSLLIDDMPVAIKNVAAVLTYGAEKYEERGWMKVDPERYRDALLRHYLAYCGGEDFDEESGLHHLAHLACNALFLLQMEGVGNPKWNKPPQNHKTG